MKRYITQPAPRAEAKARNLPRRRIIASSRVPYGYPYQTSETNGTPTFFRHITTIIEKMSLKTPNESCGLTALQHEMHLNILTFLRATDLSNVQQTCTTFNNRGLVVEVVDHFATEVVSLSADPFYLRTFFNSDIFSVPS